MSYKELFAIHLDQLCPSPLLATLVRLSHARSFALLTSSLDLVPPFLTLLPTLLYGNGGALGYASHTRFAPLGAGGTKDWKPTRYKSPSVESIDASAAGTHPPPTFLPVMDAVLGCHLGSLDDVS